MLYVLPPPTTRPPSVWDLVVDFHHKECEKNVAHHSKKLLRFHCHEPKQSQLLGSKTLALDQSNEPGRKSDDDHVACVRLLAGKCSAPMANMSLQLPSFDIPTTTDFASSSQTSNGSSSETNQHHLQLMFNLIRPEESLKMAVKLESLRADRTRYLVVVSRPLAKKSQKISESKQVQRIETVTSQTGSHHGKMSSTSCFNDTSSSGASHLSLRMSTCDNYWLDSQCRATVDETNVDVRTLTSTMEESCLIGIDCNEKTTVGLVLRVLADSAIRIDGDGGFSISGCGRRHIFKPVSVQAMWSALQTLYKISSKAHEHNFFAGGPSHDWVQYYENRIDSDRSCLNEWHAMDSLESRRPLSPDTIRSKPTERDETERVIRTALKEIMISVDLDEVTSKYIRGRLEESLDMDLGEFKSFIDEEMLVILGQMDEPTKIFDHVYLGSEWNASNLEELQRNGVRHILNVTREIDNFFPGMFDYFNVRVYDDETTDLLKHWDNTFKYISQAKKEGSKVLVHCKMGISRSASVVIAYAMKAYNWDFNEAIKHVKEKRNCVKPNKSFVTQLETYQGILDAMKNKEKLQRSKSEACLKDGRMLPGSEPTPLIQALQFNKNRTYPSSKKEETKNSSKLSKSASETVSSKPRSHSTEALASISESTNLRRTSTNHESKKVSASSKSQSDNVPLVKSLITELEQLQEKMRLKEFEEDSSQQVYSCSAEIIRQDSFIEKSSKAQTHENSPFMSRQSSCGSVDSDCTMLSSRNSSLASSKSKIHLANLTEDVVMNQNDDNAQRGNVKRTTQKIQEKNVQTLKSASAPANDAKNKNKLLCDIKKSLLIDNLSHRTQVGSSTPQKIAKLKESSSLSSFVVKNCKEVRRKSEEISSSRSKSQDTTPEQGTNSQRCIGIVKSLQKNFEVKAMKPNSKSSSVDIDDSQKTENSDDIKTLIEHYDGVSKKRKVLLLNNRQTSEKQPVARKALATSNQNVWSKIGASTRKTQQLKIHPLSKIGINKQMFTTAPYVDYKSM